MGRQRKKIQKASRNGRKKIQKTSKNNEEEGETIVPWADLPQEILGCILGKLLDAVDLIRFRAVCKNWYIDIPKDELIRYKDHRNLPWLCNLTWAEDHLSRLECEIYDPYSRQIFKSSKIVHGCRYTRCYSNIIEVIGSKKGWLIGCYYHFYMMKNEIFMYNPYSQEFIVLPFMEQEPRVATFSGDPASQNCRVFVFLFSKSNYCSPRDNYIASYCLGDDLKEWRHVFFESKQQECSGMQYVNGQLLCLFEDGTMRRYADRCCWYIVLGEGSHRLAVANQRLWLGMGEGDLLVACELSVDSSECSTFYFDWSNMCWVGSDLHKSRAVFISGTLATFVRPFEDYENKKDYKVYSIKENHPSYYTFAEMRQKRLKYFYFSTVFIEPPLIN